VIHDRGRAVLWDVAVSIAGGAQNLAGTAMLHDQGRLFGPVASVPTMWRSLGEIDDAALAQIMLVRNKARQRVWQLIEARHGAVPPSRTCYGDLGEVIVIRIDATLTQCRPRNPASPHDTRRPPLPSRPKSRPAHNLSSHQGRTHTTVKF
jgi:hypothetical protein